MVTAGQMGFGMNAYEAGNDKEYLKAVDNFGQAHLAQKNAMSNMSNNTAQMDTLKQQNNAIQQQLKSNVPTDELRGQQITATCLLYI